MKLKTEADIERIAKAIEADAGQSLDSIRDALREVKDGKLSNKTSAEQIIVRAARKKSGLSQSDFADRIDTPVRTLQEWEQGRSTPPGTAIVLCKLIIENPNLLVA